MASTPLFPNTEDFARAFYEEAARHLTEAHCLHQNSFFAGAITSAMKSGELSTYAYVFRYFDSDRVRRAGEPRPYRKRPWNVGAGFPRPPKIPGYLCTST